MYMQICVVGDVLDVITCAKFQNEIFRGYNFTGCRIFHFPIDFEWALQQCSATALPVIGPSIQLENTRWRSSVDPGQQLAICLGFIYFSIYILQTRPRSTLKDVYKNHLMHINLYRSLVGSSLLVLARW